MFIFLFVAVSSFALKEDTLSIQQKELERQSFRQVFLQNSFLNPALRFYQYPYSLSTLSVIGRDDDQYALQRHEKGDGFRGFRVNAESFVSLSPVARIWGKAYYERGKEQNRYWNESADFDKVYPYVSADTIGGDMTQETYSFQGGYAKKINRWTLGAEFAYRALLEFRKVDPRPRNTVADLQAKLAASWAFTPHYAASVFLEGQKYKQNDDIKYFNELGVSKTFHLQGLGTSYKRFDGTRTNVNYEGNLWKTGANLLPTDSESGWMAMASYAFGNLDKMLPSVNDIVLNSLADKVMEVEAGRIGKTLQSRWGSKAHFYYLKREGEQNIYGDSESNEFPLIAVSKDFSLKTMHASANFFWEKLPTTPWYYGAKLQLSYLSRKEKQASTSNLLKVDELDFELQLHSHWLWKKETFGVRLTGGYRPNLKADLNIQSAVNPYAYEILQQNFAHQEANKTRAALFVKWAHAFAGNKLAFLETSWSQLHESCNTDGHRWTLTAGLSF